MCTVLISLDQSLPLSWYKMPSKSIYWYIIAFIRYLYMSDIILFNDIDKQFHRKNILLQS